MRKKYAVQISWRVEDRHHQKVGLLLEWLRYAGLADSVVDECENNIDDLWFVFHLLPPKGVDEKTWAEQNSSRIRSFGVEAQCVRR